MNPANSDRFKREAFWSERWFSDTDTAERVAAHNAGTLRPYTEGEVTQATAVEEGDFASVHGYFEKPGTDPVPLSSVSLSLHGQREWLFLCDSNCPLDLLHPGEIKFLAKYAAEVFSPPRRVDSRERFLAEWDSIAAFVASFIGSTWRVDEACTQIAERPHIGAPWGEPQSIETYLKSVNDAWDEIHREGEEILKAENENRENSNRSGD